jgi:hypothetical protein
MPVTEVQASSRPGSNSTTSISPPTSAEPTRISIRYRAPAPWERSPETSQRVTPDMKCR